MLTDSMVFFGPFPYDIWKPKNLSSESAFWTGLVGSVQYLQYLHDVDVLHGVEGHGPEDVSDVDDILVVEPGIDT